LRQSRNYGALHETHQQTDEQQNSPSASREPRNYGALHETQHQVDEQLGQQGPERPDVLRSWTHLGGMVPQQGSANEWIRQNYEIRMAENDKPGADREGDGQQQSPQQDREQDQAELQEARAAVEEARRREAAERALQQQRERSGPER